MKQFFVLVFAGLLAFPALAQTTDPVEAGMPEAELPATDNAEPTLEALDAAEISLEDFRWTVRPIVIFADTPADPRFQKQLELLFARPSELLERDIVVIVDTDPSARSAIRKKLRPRGFMLTLIGKDGRVNLRKPFPWDVREISRAIDKWPIRRQEIRDRRAATE